MTDKSADVLVAEARRAVHESLTLLPAWEADRVRALIADLETAVESRTAIRLSAAAGVAPAADQPACDCEAEVHMGAGFYHHPWCATKQAAADQTERRERYAAAIRDRVRFRFGASVLALAQQGRPIKMTPSEAETAADAVMAVADAEQAELRARLADYENRITWHTTCGSCARVLDSSIRETERANQLADDLRYVLDYKGPGHAHEKPGVWDTSGKPCGHCARLAVARQHLDAADPLAVLPDDRAAIRAAALREGADALEALDPVEAALAGQHAWADAADRLRRVAAGAQQQETEAEPHLTPSGNVRVDHLLRNQADAPAPVAQQPAASCTAPSCLHPLTNECEHGCRAAADELAHEQQPAADDGEETPEMRCTCGVAGDGFVPLGHYADCPQANEPRP